jgi:putative ABC transport system substrate-binding protein
VAIPDISRLYVFLVIIGILVVPIGVQARSADRVPRIGVISGASAESRFGEAFFQALGDLGYARDRNVIVEWRSSGGNAERFPDLATDLVRLKVDVIVASDNPAIAAAQKATRQIPIVMVLSGDPVGSGFVASLSRPGGNITGLTGQGRELASKVPELLKEVAPSVRRVAVIWDPTEPARRAHVSAVETSGRRLGFQLRLLEAHTGADLDSAFETMTKAKADGLVVMASQMSFAHRTRIAAFATKQRLPSLGPSRWYVEAGGLMYYGTDNAERYRRAPYFIDKILRGAKPGDLPVEQPTKFELVINLKTAKALGLTIPAAVLLRADQILE